MSFHLRFTPYELSSENLTSFCDKYDKYIIAKEYNTRTGQKCEPHYHIYLESDRDIDSIRTAFKKAMGIPTGVRGAENKYYMLKKWDYDQVTYIIKQGLIEACKGYDKIQLLSRVPPWAPEGKKEEKIQETQAAPAAAKKKETNFWNEIVERAILWEKSQQKKIETEDALKLITKVYFSKGLPLPHPGDRKRWATSLYMYSRMKWIYEENNEEHEKVIEKEALDFQAEHIVTNKTV